MISPRTILSRLIRGLEPEVGHIRRAVFVAWPDEVSGLDGRTQAGLMHLAQALLDAREALDVGAWMYDISGFEIEISDDWRRVTVFKEQEKWESETFCLSGAVYKSCGKNPNAPAPKRVLTRDQ